MSLTNSRLLAALAVLLASVAFQLAPTLLAREVLVQELWSLTWLVVAPGIAASSCAITAMRARGKERQAWISFALGSAAWGAGTLIWALVDARQGVITFPGYSDAAHLLTALFFVRGMFHLVLQRRALPLIQLANLALVLSSVAMACFLPLLPILRVSDLDALGKTVAVLYPIAWFGTVAFGIISLTIYGPAEKRLTLSLLLLGCLAMAAGNLLYCLALIGKSYQIGAFLDGFWVLCFLLVAWSAVEQSIQIRLGVRVAATGDFTSSQRLVEAFLPGGAVAVICLASLVPGILTFGWMFVWFLPPALLFALFLGFREHWALSRERQLRAAESKSRKELVAVLESTTDSVVVVRRDWQIVYINRHAGDLFKSVPDFRVGADLWEVFPEEVGGNFAKQYRAAFATGKAVEFEEYLTAMAVWCEVHAYPSEDTLSVFFRDVTERRRTREQLQFLAHHDTLTGLKNRLVFRQSLEQAFRVEPPACACFFIDLDHFKEVNDALGHPTGDALLVEVAARLRWCVRDGDIVARVGGDEFAILQRQIASPHDVEILAERILAAIRAPMTVNGQFLQMGSSIGIAVSGQQSGNADEFLKTADIALYAAKAKGRGSYRFFEPEMEEQLKRHQSLKSDLSTALSRSELTLVYQPIIDLATNDVAGFEALLRWRHPERGTVSPVDFIPIAEETGLILPIGEWVMEEACREALRWPGDISVSVNVSTCEFRSPDLPERVRTALLISGLPARRLELEITESVLLQDSEANLDILHRLRELGVTIALDDFGTGYSSLSYLRTFPFTRIKIDRSFISRVEEEGQSQAIVRAVASLGHALGMAITAEGVETRQQFDRMRAEGCNQVQGDFFSKPVAPDAIPALIERVEASRIWLVKGTTRNSA